MRMRPQFTVKYMDGEWHQLFISRIAIRSSSVAVSVVWWPGSRTHCNGNRKNLNIRYVEVWWRQQQRRRHRLHTIDVWRYHSGRGLLCISCFHRAEVHSRRFGMRPFGKHDSYWNLCHCLLCRHKFDAPDRQRASRASRVCCIDISFWFAHIYFFRVFHSPALEWHSKWTVKQTHPPTRKS